MKRILFIFSLVLAFSATKAQVISIDSARTLGVGATVTIKGIITNGSELGTIRYIQDNTAGLALYSSSLSGVNRGDSIEVSGVLKDYNNLLEMDPVSSHTVLSTGNPSPVATIITPSQMSNANEGMLVKIEDASFTTNPGGTFSSNTSYNFTAGGESSSIYVRSNHPLIGKIVPSNPVDIVGIVSEYSYQPSVPGFQLLLRDTNDIISSSSIFINSKVSLTNLSQTGFDLDWTSNVAGTSEMFYGATPALGMHMEDTNKTSTHMMSITGASASELFYVKAFSVLGTDTAWAPLGVFITQSASSGDVKVYFNTDVDHTVSSGTNAVVLPQAIDDTLAAYIGRATTSIDFTMYNFTTQNIYNIATALNAADARGVVVRVIFDGSANNTGIQSLNANIKKIHSPTSSAYGIMHNKFIIIDAYDPDPNVPIVWTGATNVTDGQINVDPNDVIIIQDKSLAIAYTLEFNEMFGSAGPSPVNSEATFGPDKVDNTPHNFIIGGSDVELYFSPSDGTNDKIIEVIESADHTLHIGTMLITRSDLAYAIDAAIGNGVSTQILVNSFANCGSTVLSTLQPVMSDNFQEDVAFNVIFHHKYMIVDEGTTSDPILLTGSHNWSNAANNKNDENTLIFHNAELANIYYQNFRKRFDQNFYYSIEEQLSYSVLKVFPNPTQNQLTIQLDVLQSTEYQLQVLDLQGKVVQAQNDRLNTGAQNIELDLNHLDAGTYFVHLVSDYQNQIIKVVVQ
jgi:phosphatidylserine/phosphatidylglycerophosphate/cardiolipin synthase-like enzyme